jgi:hypothetical protein
MTTNSNTFENDFILGTLQHLVTDLKTDKPLAQILDKYASILTAYMQGKTVSVQPTTSEQNEREDLGLAAWHRQQSRIDELEKKLAEEIRIGNMRGEKIEQLFAELSAYTFDNKSLQAQLTVAIDALNYIRLEYLDGVQALVKATEALNTINKMKAG